MQPTDAKGDFFVSLYFTDDQTGYAVGLAGTILKTSDAGKSWDRLKNGNSLFNGYQQFNQIIFRNKDIGYIVGESGCFLKTIDSGNHWDQIKESPDINFNATCLTVNGGYVCGDGGTIYHSIED